MTQDLPDWTRKVQISVTVEDNAVVPAPANEVAAGDAGKYSGIDTDYREVAAWTVTAAKVGELKEIIIRSDDYAHTLAKITIGAVTWATEWAPQNSMPLIFEDLKLAAASEVKVEVKSSDGTAIEVDAIIVGKEIG